MHPETMTPAAYTILTGLASTRRARGFTQLELARLLGVSKTTVHRYETGWRIPTIPDLFHMADILGVACTDLIPELARRRAA